MTVKLSKDHIIKKMTIFFEPNRSVDFITVFCPNKKTNIIGN